VHLGLEGELARGSTSVEVLCSFFIIARILWAYHMDYHYENGEKQDVDPWDMTNAFQSYLPDS